MNSHPNSLNNQSNFYGNQNINNETLMKLLGLGLNQGNLTNLQQPQQNTQTTPQLANLISNQIGINNLTNLQGLQDLQNYQNLQNLQNLQSLQNLQNLHNQQNQTGLNNPFFNNNPRIKSTYNTVTNENFSYNLNENTFNPNLNNNNTYNNDLDSEIVINMNQLEEFLMTNLNYKNVVRDYKMSNTEIEKVEGFEIPKTEFLKKLRKRDDEEESKDLKENNECIKEENEDEEDRKLVDSRDESLSISHSNKKSCREMPKLSVTSQPTQGAVQENEMKESNKSLISELVSEDNTQKQDNNEDGKGNSLLPNKNNNKIFNLNNSGLIFKTSSMPALIISNKQENNSLPKINFKTKKTEFFSTIKKEEDTDISKSN